MKVMVIVKASKDSEAGEMPSTELLTAMGKYNEQLVKAGILLDAAGLTPSSKGARVRFSGTSRTVMDGPLWKPAWAFRNNGNASLRRLTVFPDSWGRLFTASAGTRKPIALSTISRAWRFRVPTTCPRISPRSSSSPDAMRSFRTPGMCRPSPERSMQYGQNGFQNAA